MSQVFFDELELPRPDVNLEVGSGSHAWQMVLIMQRFEPVVPGYKPDWVIVPGDVNSTGVCARVASKLQVRSCLCAKAHRCGMKMVHRHKRIFKGGNDE